MYIYIYVFNRNVYIYIYTCIRIYTEVIREQQKIDAGNNAGKFLFEALYAKNVYNMNMADQIRT